MKKDNTFKRFLKLGWSKGWTEREDKAHKAAFLMGIQEGLNQARLKENQRKRLSRKKSKLAKQLA